MAAIAAQPVFRLLGARDLGRSDDYKTEKMPAVKVGLLDGELAWRQHDGGHTDEPNIEHFIKWADKHFARADGKAATDVSPRTVAASKQSSELIRTQSQPTSSFWPKRSKAESMSTSKATRSRDDGARRTIPDSSRSGKVTSTAGTRPTLAGAAIRPRTFSGGSQNGELDGVSPKVIVLQAGTNNLPSYRTCRQSQDR